MLCCGSCWDAWRLPVLVQAAAAAQRKQVQLLLLAVQAQAHRAAALTRVLVHMLALALALAAQVLLWNQHVQPMLAMLASLSLRLAAPDE